MSLTERVRRVAAGPEGRLAFDVLLAAACLGVALVVNLSGSESVAANREDGPLTVSLTVLAVGSLALRRLWPLVTLLLTLTGVLGLVVIDGTVGAATLGPIVAAYTATAHGTARTGQRAMVIVAAALVLTWFLDPVDLSPEGTVINAAAFGAVLLLGTGVRDRRDRAVVDVRAAATQERLRITRELHDVLGHSMSVMVVQAGAAGRLLDTGDTVRARAAVAEIEQTGRRSMTEMRHLLGILRDEEESPSPRAPAPTLSDVEALVGRVGEAGLPAELTVTGERGAVSPGIDLAAYRIVQEALTNCLKHSAATRADVGIAYGADTVTVEVTDDGRGPARGETSGHGLAGMRERVAMYDGDLSVGAGAEGGFRVHAVLPREVVP
ncbi:sensor histidine kinase [Nocardioides zhouii]|uniref:histidine kinase n=1 Tax=Nocardioides zhouii TaxID=1168729 RepID=A0A4Q2T5A6_9ACTN|nr:sensor histidine kinase [Nocardioides zhouii]RYC13271.1 sensor histidine kinase [Nocardioides zhouii]